MKSWFAGAASGLVLSVSSPAAWAVESFAETPQEIAMCSAYMYGGQDKGFKMKTEGADDWGHMHHYCDCVRYRYRALRAISDKYTYKYNLGIAIGGCDYVLEKASKTFYMRPRILVDKGRAQRMLGNSGQAARSFQEAIQFNPHEVNAYLELAETHQNSGQNREALEALMQGLRNNPEAKILQRRYRELGGKEAFPEVPAKPAEPQPKAVEPEQVTPSETTVPPEAEPKKEELPVAEQLPGDKKTTEAPLEGCRFCPPESVQKKWEGSFKRDAR